MATRQLRGYLHSSQKVVARSDGSLVFDLYDFGDDDHYEYVTTIHVIGEEAAQVRVQMEKWANRPLASLDAVAEVLAQRFDTVSDARQWLEQSAIPFEEVFDPFVLGWGDAQDF